MGPIGFWEMMFIMGLALLIFGPRKLPELGRTLGRGMAEFRKASNELKRTLNAEMIQEEIRQGTEVLREHDPRRMLRDVLKEAPQQVRDKPKANATESDTTESDTTESDTTESDVTQSDATQSDVTQSDAKTSDLDPEPLPRAATDETSSTEEPSSTEEVSSTGAQPESPEGTVARSRGSSS